MPQFSIIAFDPVGLAFVGQSDMDARRVNQMIIGGTGIAVVQYRLGCSIQHHLPGLPITGEGHRPTDNAAGGPFHQGQNVGGVFFASTKVKSSSCSITVVLSGCGGMSGSVAV